MKIIQEQPILPPFDKRTLQFELTGAEIEYLAHLLESTRGDIAEALGFDYDVDVALYDGLESALIQLDPGDQRPARAGTEITIQTVGDQK